MVEIIERLKWTYISILYEESTYGIKVKCTTLQATLINLNISSIMIAE